MVNLHCFNLSDHALVDLFINITHINDPSVTLHEITSDRVVMLFSSLQEHFIDYALVMMSLAFFGCDMFPGGESNQVTAVAIGRLTLN